MRRIFLSESTSSSRQEKPLKRRPVDRLRILIWWIGTFGVALVCAYFYSLQQRKNCLISFGPYSGDDYRSEHTVGQPTCLVQSPWLRLMKHSVKFPNEKTAITDWLWIDYHDRVNVLVQGLDGKYLVFEQSKYGLEGRSSLAVIGGFIEPGEAPEVAAQREVAEEMNGMKCESFVPLGRFRTDVNRGMGWNYGFLAQKCGRRKGGGRGGGKVSAAIVDVVGEADKEQQKVKSLTPKDLRAAAREGRFLEIQWSNTVAMAMLHEEIS